MKRKRRSRYSRPLLAVAVRMAKQGGNDEQIYTALQISSSTFYRWLRNRPDFANAIALARLPAQAAEILNESKLQDLNNDERATS